MNSIFVMNISGLLQSKWYFARDSKYSRFYEHSKNWTYCLYLHFIIDTYDI